MIELNGTNCDKCVLYLFRRAEWRVERCWGEHVPCPVPGVPGQPLRHRPDARHQALQTGLPPLTTSQCFGSMTFWCGSGSADPCLLLMDPDPAIFVIDLQEANKKLVFLRITFWRYILYHFSKMKKSKRSHKTGVIKVFLLFLLDDRRIRSRNTATS